MLPISPVLPITSAQRITRKRSEHTGGDNLSAKFFRASSSVSVPPVLEEWPEAIMTEIASHLSDVRDIAALANVSERQRDAVLYSLRRRSVGEKNALICHAISHGDIAAVKFFLEHCGSAETINVANQNKKTALMLAAFLGKIEIVVLLLEVPGIHVDATDAQGRSALMLAASTGHLAVVEALLRMPAIDVNALDCAGRSTLVQAGLNDHFDVVNLLLSEPRIRVDRTVPEIGYFLLYLACTKNLHSLKNFLRLLGYKTIAVHQPIEFFLMRAIARNDHLVFNILRNIVGINFNLTDIVGRTMLMQAVFYERLAFVNSLLEYPNVDIDARDALGKDALMLAVKQSHAVVEALLRVPGINLNARDREGATALMLALQMGANLNVHALLDRMHLDEINATNHAGFTALTLAIFMNEESIVDRLLGTPGVIVNAVVKGAPSALIMAAYEGNIELVTKLLAMDGVDVNEVDANGNSALMVAVADANIDVVDVFLAVPGIELNLVNKTEGNTALMIAVKNGCADVVNALLHIPGIDINIVNRSYMSALMMAAVNGNLVMVDTLLAEANPAVNQVDRNGCTALMLAVHGNHADVVELLLREDEIDLDVVSNNGDTALMLADRPDIIQMLLRKQLGSQ